MNDLKADDQLSLSLLRISIIHKLERDDSNSEINSWIHYWYRGVMFCLLTFDRKELNQLKKW